MPPSARAELEGLLRSLGYPRVEHDFRYQETPAGEPVVASLVAFWQDPPDQFATGIAVPSIDGAKSEPTRLLDQAVRGLWAPYAILAGPTHWSLWETLPEAAPNGRRYAQVEDWAPYDALHRLRVHEARIGASVVAERKRRWRQMALWEADRGENAFFEWAYAPTKRDLATIINRAVSEATVELAGGDEFHRDALRWMFRLVGTRIAWDKGWIPAGNRVSAADLLLSASSYPTTLSPSSLAEAPRLAEIVVEKLSNVDLRVADRALLSDLVQGSALPAAVQRDWRLHCTPADLAWRMLEGLPIERLDPDHRVVFDGTCGSGTLLVAAMERLSRMPDAGKFDPTAQIRGNDKEAALTDISRVALDLAVGSAFGARWDIRTSDVRELDIKPRPSVIVGNPPFAATGKGADLANSIGRRYLEMLRDGGLLALVLPKSALSADSWAAFRRQLLAGRLIEVWDVASRAFPRANAETCVVLADVKPGGVSPSPFTTWRSMNRDRTRETVAVVVQDSWTASPRAAIESAVGVELRRTVDGLKRLGDFVPASMRGEGITPGAASDAISTEPKIGSSPYLARRADMLPFFVPWILGPTWIDLDRPDLRWPRKDLQPMLVRPKVIVARHAYRGAGWPMLAAHDTVGICPSDQFFAIRPNAPLDPDVLTGLLNSAFGNVWMAVTSPGYSLRLRLLLDFPIPDGLAGDVLSEIGELGKAISAERDKLEQAQLPVIVDLTGRLDEAVFAAYGTDDAVRDAVVGHFEQIGAPRPGLGGLLGIERHRGSGVADEQLFRRSDADRMEELFSARDHRPLAPAEESELILLVKQWEKAAYARLPGDGGEPTGRG